MIIWLNGPFGSGKTTLSEALLKRIPNSIIFDPELIGYAIHKTVPESRSEDFQNFPMWRQHVTLFAKNLVQEFGKNLIIPMTLVKREYIDEIQGSLKSSELRFFHFFLQLEESTLRKRIEEQVLVPQDSAKDQEVRQWRLDQVNRCLNAVQNLPKETLFLNSGTESPDELVARVLDAVNNKK